MDDLHNNAYQESVDKSVLHPLTSFLEDVQSKTGLGKQGLRNTFNPHTHEHGVKQYSLNESLETIEKLRQEDEDEDTDDELDDIGNVEVDADESPEVDPETDVSDVDIDNEVDPEEGKIVGDDGEKIGSIFIGPGQRYFMGASTDPQMVIVSKVSDEYVWYNSFPFKKAEKIKKDIAADLFATGSQTWLKSPQSKSDPDLRSSIESVLNGRPGERVSLDDYQFSSIQVKYTGESSGDLDPWKELESEYDIVVDSNLTNKQTYNIRMNNKELENFRSHLQEKPVSERNYKIIRIVTEERQYMIESTINPVPKAVKREVEDIERDDLAHALIHNTASSYGAEGFSAGEPVVYEKEVYQIVDFVPFGEKMTVILMDSSHQNLVEFASIEKLTKCVEEKPDAIKIDQTPKDKKVDFPESDPKSGETKKQKALNEESEDDNKKAGALVEFINKDPELKKNRFKSVIKNLQRKRNDGNYDSLLAEKAFRVLIDEGASKYFNANDQKIFGEVYSSATEMFSRVIKDKVAKEFRNQFEANVEMGNMEESIEKKIANLVMEANENIMEASGEAIPFTSQETTELKKFDTADVTAENIATFTWDTNTNNFKVEITKKPRAATNDIVYTSVSTSGDNDEIDESRTKDSESFRTQADIPILRNFLTTLNLNESSDLTEDDEVNVRDVHPEQLIMGIKKEMEHTESQEEAKKIALEHLKEIPDYYTQLKTKVKKSKVTEEKKVVNKPSKTSTRMVNALPVKEGKKIRSEIVGDMRIRYMTYEEKRKKDLEQKANAKPKGEK